MENKRLFFGFEIFSPWPDVLPRGRVLLEEDRHLTLAFFENANTEKLLHYELKIPFQIGIGGFFDRVIFLQRVVSWHIHWLEKEKELLDFQKELKNEKREFLSHVTIARSPFDKSAWEKSFEKLPVFIGNFNLYESLGFSHYEVLKSFPLLPPFEEKEHTADIAFLIRGKTLSELFLHAQLALTKSPSLVNYFSSQEVKNLDDIVQMLGVMIAKSDAEIGSPFKAVSYHGEVKEGEILEWEMIVDV